MLFGRHLLRRLLADKEVEALWNTIQVRRRAQKRPLRLELPRHFALVAAETVTPFRKSRLEQSGIRLIPQDNADGKHAAVTATLRDLAARPGAGARIPRSRSIEVAFGLRYRAGVRAKRCFHGCNWVPVYRPVDFNE